MVPKNDLVTRLRDVLAAFLQRAEAAFVDDAAAVQHDDAVGVVGAERLRPRHRLRLAERCERDRLEVVPLGARQWRRRAKAARDVRRRTELAAVRERPAKRGNV